MCTVCLKKIPKTFLLFLLRNSTNGYVHCLWCFYDEMLKKSSFMFHLVVYQTVRISCLNYPYFYVSQLFYLITWRFFCDDGDDGDDDDDDATSGSSDHYWKHFCHYQYSYCGCAVAAHFYQGSSPDVSPHPASQGLHAVHFVRCQSYHC